MIPALAFQKPRLMQQRRAVSTEFFTKVRFVSKINEIGRAHV